MKQKSRNQNIDKCKIFDLLAKKAGYKSFQIFVRRYGGTMFGLNGSIDDENSACAMYDSGSMGSAISDFVHKKKLSKWHDFRHYTLESFPREFKEAVIDHCVGTGISILMNGKTFIPAISCLEELAIKVELERQAV